MSEFVFELAERKAVPQLISLSGTSGSGKTYTALLIAAGLAGPDGVVGMIDTENGRGRLYADSPGIVKALPKGYRRLQLDPQFSPERYIKAIDVAEKSGINVLVIDSVTHEWEGIGGCTEIAENNKRGGMPNWAKAKMEHKKFVNRCLASNMHIIFCIRARDKVKIEKVNGKDEVIPIGIQPVTEKNFVFEMLISILLDEKTHTAIPLKVPEPLQKIFNGEPRLLSSADGVAIREWNNGGAAYDINERLKLQAKLAAETGTSTYAEFFGRLTAKEKQYLRETIHAELKEKAAKVDKEARAAEGEEQKQGGGLMVATNKWEDLEQRAGTNRFLGALKDMKFGSVDDIPAEDRERVYDELVDLLIQAPAA